MLTSAIISGLGLGSMYGLIALGFHVTYVVSSTVNFSQGSAMMLGAVLGYTFAVTLGWPWPLAAAMSLALCALAGLLIAPLYGVHSDMGTLFGIKAFAAAILGGITSAAGVMLAGLAYGLIEAMVTAYLGSVYTQIVAFTVVILALAFLPNGLMGR